MNWNENGERLIGARTKCTRYFRIDVMKSLIISKNVIEITKPTLACLHSHTYTNTTLHID